MAAPCSLTLISPPLLTFTALLSIVNPLSGAYGVRWISSCANCQPSMGTQGAYFVKKV
jgi:hypothetical protein